jgi:hypothetical protein
MRNIESGIKEAIVGAVAGLILSTFVKALAQDSSIPSYAVGILYAFNIIVGVVSIFALRTVGTLYLVGWIIGSLIVKDVMEPLDIFLNIALPIIFLAIKAAYWVKDKAS